jgi:hypothetical protein
VAIPLSSSDLTKSCSFSLIAALTPVHATPTL